MSLSLNNSTILPLSSGGIFLGSQYDNILDFSEINISIKCDVGYTLTYIYSQDKIVIDYETSQVIAAQVDTQFYKPPVNDRYFKLKIEATDGDMSVLNVQTIYKSSTTFDNAGASSNVTIVSPLTSGAVSVNVSNFPATQPVSGSVSVTGSVAVTNSDITNIYNVVNSKTSGSLWNANVTGVNGVSTSVDLAGKNIKNLTFMGNCNGATVLTVQFSSDGSNWYDSQYAYTLSASGDVGFNISCCPNYVRLKSSASVTATMLLNCC
jgi:hypothetical protein